MKKKLVEYPVVRKTESRNRDGEMIVTGVFYGIPAAVAEATDAVVEAARRTEKDLREVVNPRIRAAGFHPPDLCVKDLAQALAALDKVVQGGS